MSGGDSPLRAALLEQRGLFMGALWFSLFINLLMLAVPIYTMQVLDRVLSSGSTDTLVMLAVIAGGALLFAGLLQGLRALVFSHIGRWLDDKLSADLVLKTVEAAVHKPGIGAQPLRDLAAVRGFVTSPALAGLFDAPWAVIYFVAIFLINAVLGMIVLASAAALLLLALLAEKAPAAKAALAGDENIKSLRAVDALVRNAEVLKAMGFIEAARRKWRAHNRKGVAFAFSAANILTVISNATRSFRMGLQIALTGLGAWLVLRGAMSPGGIIAVSILSGKALAPFDAAAGVYQNWVGVKKAVRRLKELEESTGRLTAQAGKLSLPPPEGRLQVEKLTFQEQHSGRWILRGVNFHLSAGESLGIIGPSGGGKTTLARLLVGVLTPTSGHVRLDGAALGQWDAGRLGAAIGYLPQDVELFDGRVAENIARLDVDAADEKVVEAAQLAEVHDVILRLPQGYQTAIGPGGAFLSAGQRQRIALARCFFGGPGLVVLDEPNANLDTEGEEALVKCLRNAAARRITTITIAHRPSVLAAVDKILLLQGGEAKLFGPTAEVLRKLAAGGQKPTAPAGVAAA